MPNLIQIKRSSVAGKTPSTSDLELGELAVNTYDGKLYTKKSVSGSASIVELSAGQGQTGPIIESQQVINENITILPGRNGMSIGDVTVSDGYTVTISSGSSWRVIL